MVNKEKYFENGELRRESIAMDIKFRTISHDDLMALIDDPDISAKFYGSPVSKIPNKEWDQQYLDKLSYAVVSECFHKEYLLYLEQVANSVVKKKNNYKIVIGSILLSIVAFLLITFVLVNK